MVPVNINFQFLLCVKSVLFLKCILFLHFSREWALDRLRRKQEVDSNFNYLLKLRQRKLSQYILLYLPLRHSVPKYHEIEQRFEPQSNCHMFHLSVDENRDFVSISQLLEFYRKEGNSTLLGLHRCVVPMNPGEVQFI